jgi:tRNA threonylcarbamoyladenosine biosynthesis protein TsaB
VIRLAIETATDRATVALGHGPADAIEREIMGARRHAAGLIPALADLLADSGRSLAQISGLVLSDGPGSFTGLRVGGAVAKALARARGWPVWAAPSLLVRAAGVAKEGQTVLAVTDALRGEVYAAAYRFGSAEIEAVLPAAVYRPEALGPDLLRPDRLVGDVPAPLASVLEQALGLELITGERAAPRARVLLGLADRAGGAVPIARVESWEPVYGRPAEAQARWETAHGRALPGTSGRSV